MRSILATVLTIPSMSNGFSLPPPPGKFNVSITDGILVDHSRNDRALVLSVFQPATCKSVVEVPYMSNATAAIQGPFIQKRFGLEADLSPIILEARLPVCTGKQFLRRSEDCAPARDELPVILISSGFASPRGYYSVLASAIASEGFTVLTVDHPGESNSITYPDGHTEVFVTPEPQSLDDIVPFLEPRILDTGFILDQLSNATAMGQFIPHRGAHPFPTGRIAMLGHSLGGVTAVHFAAQDSRIHAVIDWDQQLFGPTLTSNFTTPTMFFNRPNSTEPNWLDAWPQIQGPILEVEVANTTHQSFFDAPTLISASGADPTLLADFVGTINAAHMLKIQVAYAVEWVRGAFSGKIGGPLLEGKEHDKYPEVTVIERRGF